MGHGIWNRVLVRGGVSPIAGHIRHLFGGGENL